jgi:hypothetical protein
MIGTAKAHERHSKGIQKAIGTRKAQEMHMKRQKKGTRNAHEMHMKCT